MSPSPESEPPSPKKQVGKKSPSSQREDFASLGRPGPAPEVRPDVPLLSPHKDPPTQSNPEHPAFSAGGVWWGGEDLPNPRLCILPFVWRRTFPLVAAADGLPVAPSAGGWAARMREIYPFIEENKSRRQLLPCLRRRPCCESSAGSRWHRFAHFRGDLGIIKWGRRSSPPDLLGTVACAEGLSADAESWGVCSGHFLPPQIPSNAEAEGVAFPRVITQPR